MIRLCTFLLVAAACGCASTSGSSALGGPESRLVSFARGLNIRPASPRACPGEVIAATYEVRIDGGTVLPLTESDVSGLVRKAVAAEPTRNGGWLSSADALASAHSGFRLSASLGRDTTVRGDTVVVPSYACRRPEWDARPIGPLPDKAYVRLGTLATPFYDSIVVAVLEIAGRTPSVTIFGPGDVQRGALRINAAGANGTAGHAGLSGPSGVECADGGDGHDGDDGRDGEPGRDVDIIVQAGSEWLADLVSVFNPGGHGGAGGAAGAGGAPGFVPRGASCSPKAGRPGQRGTSGRDGQPGLRPKVSSVPLTLLWSGSPIWSDSTSRRVLSELIQYTAKAVR